MQSNSWLKRGFVIGALLLAGLFFWGRLDTDKKQQVKILKPSQVDFTRSNQVRELAAPAPPASIEKKDKIEPPKLSQKDLKAWSTLEDILKSKNDNDPRMDKDLKVMSSEMHEALFEKYDSLPMENRNGRGLITFLVARDLKSAADAEFLRKVYQESPCTSFEDCKNVGSDDPHYSGLNQTSLNYPQLAGLYQIEARLAQNGEILKDSNVRDAIVGFLHQAAGFPVPVVSQKAEEISRKFKL